MKVRNRTTLVALVIASVLGLHCRSVEAQCGPINPPSNLPTNTPASYNLIVPLVGQQESAWCWAACGQMTDNYADPLPEVQQCQEANAIFGPSGPEPQPPPGSSCTAAWSDCCANGSSCACNVGTGGPDPAFPFNCYYAANGATLTWDQLRYQIWVVNEPFAFGWTFVNCCNHIMVVTGYSTDAQGNNWVYVNNPDPVGQGDFECMSYDEWVQDTSISSPFGAHTHIGDWFDSSYAGGTQLIYNLATNSTVPVTALTEAQAPNLAGTVISDRVVPFQIANRFPFPGTVSGTIQERVVQETASQTLDFYYRVTNAPTSAGNVTQLTIQGFGRATVAPAWRPDSLGGMTASQASRDISGNDIQIYLQAIPPGGSSHFILLMTDATTSNDQGSMGITTADSMWFNLGGYGQIATDQPTATPTTTASGSACPVMTQPLNQPVTNAEPQSPEASRGLPGRLESDKATNARKVATAALPAGSKATVGSPIQLALVGLKPLASYDSGQADASLVEPQTGVIVPVMLEGGKYLGIFLRSSRNSFVPVGTGGSNMTELAVHAMEAVAKQHHVPVESLTVVRIPALFASFVARPAEGKIWLTPVSDDKTYDLKAGQELAAGALFSRLRPAAQRYQPPGFPGATRKPAYKIPNQ